MTETVHQKEFRATASNAGLIGGAAFLGALVGFVLQLLVAYYFGAGSTTDAFFMAQTTSEMLSKLLLGGSITSVFVPMFVAKLVAHKRDDAWVMALNLFHLLAGVYIALIILLAVFARPFTHFIAPGFDAPTFELTVMLLRILLPSFLFLFLVEFVTSLLQSLKQFVLPALLRIVAPAISIVTIVALAPKIGIAALAIGVVIGSVIQFIILAVGLHRQGFAYQFIFQPTDPTVRQLLHLVYPFILSVLMVQGAGVVYRVLVSDLSPGSLASLKFAEKITQLLTIMFLNSVTMVIYPTLSAKASQSDTNGMRQTIASSIRLIVFATLPIVVGVALLRQPLVAVLFQRGSFSAHDAAMTSIALLFLVIGLTTNGISSVFGHTVLAFKRTGLAVAVSVAAQAVAIALFTLLVPIMGHAGLALASSLVPVAAAILYGLVLWQYIPNLAGVFWHATYAKTITITIGMAVAVIATLALVPPRPLLQLIIPTAVGGVLFLTASYAWKIDEMHQIIAIGRQKVLKLRSAL